MYKNNLLVDIREYYEKNGETPAAATPHPTAPTHARTHTHTLEDGHVRARAFLKQRANSSSSSSILADHVGRRVASGEEGYQPPSRAVEGARRADPSNRSYRRPERMRSAVLTRMGTRDCAQGPPPRGGSLTGRTRCPTSGVST